MISSIDSIVENKAMGERIFKNRISESYSFSWIEKQVPNLRISPWKEACRIQQFMRGHCDLLHFATR